MKVAVDSVLSNVSLDTIADQILERSADMFRKMDETCKRMVENDNCVTDVPEPARTTS